MTDNSNRNYDHIQFNRKPFSNYNVVRMREAIRYLSDDKLKIFIEIPFLIHINSKGYKGYIDSEFNTHGIWNFENSGFFKQAAKRKIFPINIIEESKNIKPMILGLYHIGSLGTFTQSSDSDFDYWVVVDGNSMEGKHLECLKKKLDIIVQYSREKYGQQVTFFIMDHKDIQQNNYPSLIGEDAFTAPKSFLKEEFYRTFLMIAGKIPAWALIHEGIDQNSQLLIPDDIPEDIIDFGNINCAGEEDILKGLLWHVLKSFQDPVKALIKSTMIFSYWFGNPSHKQFLCNELKAGYSKAGLDDYMMDPYKILFDRLIEYHQQKEPDSLNTIKTTLFFRLCGYPFVKIPAKNSPKRQLLDKYIRSWGLKKKQVIKLLAFQKWSEAEKLLYEQTLLSRLEKMYKIALQKFGQKVVLGFFKGAEQRNWKILKNKTKNRLKKGSDNIPSCSSFLKRKKIKHMQLEMIKQGKWDLIVIDAKTKDTEILYRGPSLFQIFGWILVNRLYDRNNASINCNYKFDIYESTANPISLDKIYLSLQPLIPLSDKCFEQEPKWKKSAVLLVFTNDEAGEILNLDRAEFLITNTWGEIFFEKISFNQNEKIIEKYEKIAKKLAKFFDPDFRFFIYQMTDEHNSDIVYHIRRAFEMNISDKSDALYQNNKRRPYLDLL
ncbi:MAG: adenylate cyclase [Desulfobacteraceae bacterium]|nr:adenylate cyclase [Desulfobacteraceae bacterium]